MPSFNRVIFIGNITKDIELKQTPSGKDVASFSIAVNRKKSARDGEKQADFFKIVAWDKTANFVSQWFKKGDPILVVGKMQNRSYTDNNGVQRYVSEVVADEVDFISIKGEESIRSVAGEFAIHDAAEQTVTPNYVPIGEEDDLPF